MQLRPYQGNARAFLLPRRRGFVVAPAGSGKTVIAASSAAAVARPGWRIGWLANTREQCEQAIKAIENCPGPDDVEFDVQCAAAQPDFRDKDLVIVDEAHHAPAETWLATLSGCRGIVWGFSATPWSDREPERNDLVRSLFVDFFTISREEVMAGGHLATGKVWIHAVDVPGQFDEAIKAEVEPEVERQYAARPVLFGDGGYHACIANITAHVTRMRQLFGREFVDRASKGFIRPEDMTEAQRLAVEEAQRLTDKKVDYVKAEYRRREQWRVTQRTVINNHSRNAAIVHLTRTEAAAGESVLVLVASVEHGQALAAAIGGDAVVVHSKLGKKKRTQYIEEFRTGARRVLLATSLADEGLDVPRASRLVLAAGGRSSGKLEQRAGRVLRPFEGKAGGVIHDFLDAGAQFARAQAQARVRTYERLGYEPEILSYVSPTQPTPV